jgi:iron complex transport system ATP-binding protein
MNLRAQGITLRRGQARILHGIDLTCASGEMVGLLGPNGAGKSTLLHALAGGLPIESGAIGFDGSDDWQPLKRRARRMAVLSQRIDLDFPMPVRDVVRLGRQPFRAKALPAGASRATPLRRSAAQTEHIVDAALTAVGLLPRASDLYATLSGGQQQRVQLARALAQLWPQPDQPRGYLLLDEPTAHQDPHGVTFVLQSMRRFAAEGHGVICVLHDLNLAAAAFDRLVLMRAGRIVRTGPPVDVLDAATLARVYDTQLTVLRPTGMAHPIVLHAAGDLDD